MTGIFRVRDAMGREHWQEQPIDALLPRSSGTVLSRIAEDDLEEIRRRVR